jgi:hypothetical protein
MEKGTQNGNIEVAKMSKIVKTENSCHGLLHLSDFFISQCHHRHHHYFFYNFHNLNSHIAT